MNAIRGPRRLGTVCDQLETSCAKRSCVSKRQQASDADTGIGLLVIRAANQFVGYCGLTVGRASLAEPELAYELLHVNQGAGYATEAADAVVHAAGATGRRRLWATVRPWNDASFRVLGKVGFERTERTTTDDFGDIVWWTREL